MTAPSSVDKALMLAEIQDIEELSMFSTFTFCETFRGTCREEDLEEFCKSNYNQSILRKEWENPYSQFWILKDNGAMIAYCKINLSNPIPFPKTGTGMEIQRLYIDPKFQGQQLGKILMNHALDIALDNKESTIWLGVWEFNHRARKFYEGLGYYYFGSHSFPIGKTAQTDLWMFKPI